MATVLDNILEANTLAVISFLFAVVTAFVTWLIRIPWWLRSQFIELKESMAAWLEEHESKDQSRHEDNLIRLTKLETKLDLVNGHKKTQTQP